MVNLSKNAEGKSAPRDTVELLGAGRQSKDFEIPTGTLKLELKFPAGVGKPQHMYPHSFHIAGEDRSSQRASTIKDSTVTFESVAPGTYTLTSSSVKVGSDGYILGSPTSVEFRGGKEPQVVQVQMLLGCTVVGTVSNVPAGTGRFEVFLFTKETGHYFKDSESVRKGDFRFTGLPEGEYWLSTVYDQGEENPRVRVQAKSGVISQAVVPFRAQENH